MTRGALDALLVELLGGLDHGETILLWLDVASWTLIGFLVKQMWMGRLPLIHGLHRCPALEVEWTRYSGS